MQSLADEDDYEFPTQYEGTEGSTPLVLDVPAMSYTLGLVERQPQIQDLLNVSYWVHHYVLWVDVVVQE